MSHILTLVASDAPLSETHILSAGEVLGQSNIQHKGDLVWLAPERAVDLTLSAAPSDETLSAIRGALYADKIDVFLTPLEGRRKKLLLADMDSTIVTGETLDDLAEFAGIKEKVAAITARAMNGELDFHAAIKERVGLLEGLSTNALHETLAHTKISPGAEKLVGTMKAHGATCVLVSGGFTYFTQSIAEKLGFHHNHGNTLGLHKGISAGMEVESLTGEVIPPILDKHAKVEFLEHYLKAHHLTEDQAMTIGDGANDLPMLQKAGLGVGYHAKPSVAAQLTNLIVHGDLSAALYAQGYKASEIKS